MDQYSREFIAEKAWLRPEDLGLVRTARRSHNQLGLAYQIAFIRLTGRARPGQQPFEILEILEDLVGYVATELNANPRDLDLYARRGLLKGEQLHVGETWRSGFSSTKPNLLRSTSSRPAHLSKHPG